MGRMRRLRSSVNSIAIAIVVAALAGGCASALEVQPLERDRAEHRAVVTSAPVEGPCDAAACGPAPGLPTWVCPDGVHHGGRGPCARLADGRCGWVRLECPPGTPTTSTRPPVRASCDPLPSVAELKTWSVGELCEPGGGPAPPPLTRVASLDDGTHIFQGPQSCFRARFKRCFSK